MQRLTHWVDDVVACDEDRLPDELFDRIVALGERAREKLTELATDPVWRGASADGGGFVPLHALEVLAALPPDGATATRLVESIVADPDAVEVDDLIDCLLAAGATATLPLIEALAATADAAAARALSETLCVGEARDEAVYAALMNAFERFPGDVAPSLGAFGDARAIPALRSEVSARFVGAGSRSASDEDVVTMTGAVEDLGGEPTAEETAKRDLALRRLERVRRREVAAPDDAPFDGDLVAPPRPGPNEPCPCGSGRKFKKCHEGDAEFAGTPGAPGEDEP